MDDYQKLGGVDREEKEKENQTEAMARTSGRNHFVVMPWQDMPEGYFGAGHGFCLPFSKTWCIHQAAFWGGD